MKLFWGFILSLFSIESFALSIPIKKLPMTLDPQSYEDIYSMVAILQVHRGLMKFKPNLEIENDIAESYKVLDEGKTIRFKIASRRFSDGTKISSKHVVNTLRRMFRNKSGFSADLNYISGAKGILNGSSKVKSLGVVAIDDATVEFHLEKPVGIFFAHLASVDMSILPVEHDLEFNWRHAPGAGPYTLKNNKKNEMTLARVDGGKTAAPKVVTLIQMSDAEALNAALLGKIDSLDGYSVSVDAAKKLQDKGWSQSVTTMTRQLFLVLNPNHISEEVRVLVQDSIANMNFEKLPASYQRAYGIVPYGLAGAITEKPPIKNLKKHTETINLVVDMVDAEPVIGAVIDQVKIELSKINIFLKINKISIDQYLEKIKSKNFDMMVRSKFLDYPDAVSILTYFRSGYSANTFFVDNIKVDRLLDQSMSELSVEKRAEIYKKIQKEILSERSVVPLVFGSDNLGLWSSSVSRVPAHPLGIQGLPFEELVLKSRQ